MRQLRAHAELESIAKNKSLAPIEANRLTAIALDELHAAKIAVSIRYN